MFSSVPEVINLRLSSLNPGPLCKARMIILLMDLGLRQKGNSTSEFFCFSYLSWFFTYLILQKWIQCNLTSTDIKSNHFRNIFPRLWTLGLWGLQVALLHLVPHENSKVRRDGRLKWGTETLSWYYLVHLIAVQMYWSLPQSDPVLTPKSLHRPVSFA